MLQQQLLKADITEESSMRSKPVPEVHLGNLEISFLVTGVGSVATAWALKAMDYM